VAGLKKDGRKTLASSRAMSAGGIVVRRGERGPQLILGRRRRERDGVTWSLPKGTPNRGESIAETAVREVEEETGLEVRIVSVAGAIRYFFVQDGRRIHKTVHYFLMQPTGGDLSRHDREFEEVQWLDLGEAERLMSYPTERQLVADATAEIEALGA
jgi:8-oxo-dGTP pyrophosphatase MutT (NUDIX family)